MKIEINYELSYKNNFGRDVNKAVKYYMNDVGLEYIMPCDENGVGSIQGFVLYPQALNPFLKIMETLNETKNIVIIPAFNNDDYENCNQPAYLILKLPLEIKMVDSINICNL